MLCLIIIAMLCMYSYKLNNKKTTKKVNYCVGRRWILGSGFRVLGSGLRDCWFLGSGFSGLAGLAGRSGCSGCSGLSGWVGLVGFSGFSGC